MKWIIGVFLMSLLASNASEHIIRTTVDENFLKANSKHIQVQTIVKGDTLCPFIFFSEEFLKGHVETWAKIKSKSGEMILSVPVSYTKKKGGTSSVLVFQFSTKSVSLDSVLELTIKRSDRMVYTIPLRLFAKKGATAHR